MLVKLLMLVLLFASASELGIPGDLPSSLEESLCALPTLLRLTRLGPAPFCARSEKFEAAGDKRAGGEGDSVSRCALSSAVGWMRRTPLALGPLCFGMLE